MFILRKDQMVPVACFGIDSHGDYWELFGLCVSEKYRNLGIGSEIIQHSIKAAHKAMKILIAMSKSAHEWFVRFGFINEPYNFLPQQRRSQVDSSRGSKLMAYYLEDKLKTTGKYRIRLTRSCKQFIYDPERDISIIEAASRQNIVMNSLCKAGVCGTCSVRILNGESKCFIEQINLQHSGRIFPCVSEPLSNMILEA